MLKIKVIFLSISLACLPVLLLGCASSHENVSEHHHHPEAQFKGKCAYSVMNGKYDIDGKPDLFIEHHGVKYFFSSKEAMAKFSDHVDENVEKANKVWLRDAKR